jgi:predicted ATPase/DNA-binding winged helix-turn-helix (wHTH) protein
MAPRPPLCFDGFTLDLDNERLLKHGSLVALTPKAFALLAHLAERPDRLVLKDELLDAVWGRRFVSEGTIKSLLAELRAAMGDDARTPRWVQTVPRRGLRFIGRLQQPGVAGAELPRPPAATATAVPIATPGLPPGESAPIARADEQQALVQALAAHRLVTLTGPAGVGKTCLSLAVAAALAATTPVWWVELAPLAPADADAAALRSVLVAGLRLAGSAGASDEALAAAAYPLQGLLVLDNAEHVVEPLASLVARVLRHAPGLRVLVTSREPLKVGAEQVMRLAPLAVPEAADDADPARVRASAAVRLFSARVAAQLPGFALTDDQCAAAARVCRALDGLPLAVEMAAARVPVLGVRGLAEHLGADAADGMPGSGRLGLLTQGLRDLAPHQRTLRASIAWSHTLLTETQRRVLRRLAVFSGGFTLEAACNVCAWDLGAGQVLDAVHALLEKSLISIGSAAHASEQRRFMLLESVREFAAEQLQAAAEAADARRAHVRAMERQWRLADDLALDAPAMQWLEQHAPDLDNLRAALRHARAGAQAGEAGMAEALFSLIGSAHLLWLRQALPHEGRAWCESAAACAAALPAGAAAEEALARVDLTRAGITFIYRAIPIVDGLAAAERAIAVFERNGDARRLFHAHALAGSILTEVGRADEADRRHLPALRALVQPGWSRLRLRYLRNAEGMAARRRGDLQTFRTLAREEWTVSREHGAQGESWTAAYTLALAEGLHGAPDAALAVTSAVVPEVLAAGRVQQCGQLLSLHALLTAWHRGPDEARRALAVSTPLIPLMGACEIQWLALAWLAWHEGRPDDAAGVLGWFESPAQGAAARYGSSTLVGTLRAELARLLQQRLGAASADAARREGQGWGADRALAVGLARAPGRAGRASPS